MQFAFANEVVRCTQKGFPSCISCHSLSCLFKATSFLGRQAARKELFTCFHFQPLIAGPTSGLVKGSLAFQAFNKLFISVVLGTDRISVDSAWKAVLTESDCLLKNSSNVRAWKVSQTTERFHRLVFCATNWPIAIWFGVDQHIVLFHDQFCSHKRQRT